MFEDDKTVCVCMWGRELDKVIVTLLSLVPTHTLCRSLKFLHVVSAVTADRE